MGYFLCQLCELWELPVGLTPFSKSLVLPLNFNVYSYTFHCYFTFYAKYNLFWWIIETQVPLWRWRFIFLYGLSHCKVFKVSVWVPSAMSSNCPLHVLIHLHPLHTNIAVLYMTAYLEVSIQSQLINTPTQILWSHHQSWWDSNEHRTVTQSLPSYTQQYL